MESNIIDNFFRSYFSFGLMRSPYSQDSPKEMMASPVNEEGWFTWKPIDGTLAISQYSKVEEKYMVNFPLTFIAWHRRYFFLDCDCTLLRLPYSNPNKPLEEIIDILDNDSAHELAKINLYPFAMEGNDGGFLVFDGRVEKENNEFPIRVYVASEELDGLSAIIFSSFSKLLECLTHFMKEIKTRHDFEVIPDFLEIDPTGAGKYGKEYWQGWVDMMKFNYEDLEKNPWPF